MAEDIKDPEEILEADPIETQAEAEDKKEDIREQMNIKEEVIRDLIETIRASGALSAGETKAIKDAIETTRGELSALRAELSEVNAFMKTMKPEDKATEVKPEDKAPEPEPQKKRNKYDRHFRRGN